MAMFVALLGILAWGHHHGWEQLLSKTEDEAISVRLPRSLPRANRTVGGSSAG
jgi:hypothetical protein